MRVAFSFCLSFCLPFALSLSLPIINSLLLYLSLLSLLFIAVWSKKPMLKYPAITTSDQKFCLLSNETKYPIASDGSFIKMLSSLQEKNRA
jgi:hypothetical protein